ncbi:MAG TPA: hypothetical protein VJ044_20735 [Candidatus Hodarchaeales archaeon]|nr:hypothetical protein [Candidatus Hodarchaeales archaeon]
MNDVVKWFLFVSGLITLISSIVFGIALFLKSRRLKKRKTLYCEIYLKKGGRDVLSKLIDDSFFTTRKNDVSRRYFIIKEAIQEEFRKGLLSTSIYRYIQFDEDVAIPFVMSDVDSKLTKTFVGSERVEQFIRTHIWEQVGGIGDSKNMAAIGGVIVLVLGLAIMAFLFLR